MAIAHYIKEIGRGKEGARDLTREQATDLMGLILDGQVSDLEMGAFCVAMRIKGETAQEMAGFLDAVHARLQPLRSTASQPVIVIPSYNGARKLPLLVPLLALLLARRGHAVLVHGTPTEDSRVFVDALTGPLGIHSPADAQAFDSLIQAGITKGTATFVRTELLCPALVRLLAVRRSIGLRNPAHSLVKLMNPLIPTPTVLVSSYTHPEYATSMAATLQITGQTTLLLRGTEGEAVADPRRTPAMLSVLRGQPVQQHEAQTGTLEQLPGLPALDPASTVAYTRAVLDGVQAVPASIATQIERIEWLLSHP